MDFKEIKDNFYKYYFNNNASVNMQTCLIKFLIIDEKDILYFYQNTYLLMNKLTVIFCLKEQQIY